MSRRWMRLAIVGALVAVGVAGIVGTRATTQAAVCTDIWIGGADNNFGTAANWSTGAVPGTTDDTCITATTHTTPPANADTYNVILNASFSIRSLSIGAPSGTQTLLIPASGAQLTLNAASTIGANGVITMGDSGGGDSLLCCAAVTLTNLGNLNTVTGGGGNRFMRVNLTNEASGTIVIGGPTPQDDGGGGVTTVTNKGTFSVTSGIYGVDGSSPPTFVNSGGSLVNSGSFFLGTGIFVQRGGTESGNPILLRNGSTLDDDLSAAAGNFKFANGTATLTGTGLTPGVAAGQVVTVGASDIQANLAKDLTNAGTINVGDAAFGYGIVCCATETLTNTGHLNTLVGGGGSRYLRSNVTNASGGTVDLAAPTLQDGGGGGATTTTNNGTFTIETGGSLALSGSNPPSFVNSGGSISNNGMFSMQSGTFFQRSGTESGNAVVIGNGTTLDDDVSGGPGLFKFASGTQTLTGTGAHPGVSAGQVLTVAANNSQTNLGVDLTNAGTINLGDAGSGYAILCCAGRTLTSTGHLNTVVGGGGNRYLRLNLTNNTGGVVHIGAPTLQDGGSGAGTRTINNGTFTVDATGTLALSGSDPAYFENLAGSLTNSGAFSLSPGTFVQRSGAESGNPVRLNNASTLDDDTTGGVGLFTFTSGTAVLTGSGSSPGVASGQVVTIAGNANTTQLAADLTNGGTIILGDAGNGYSILCCNDRTLTNYGHINTVPGGGGNRYLRVNITNASGGNIDIDDFTIQDGNGLGSGGTVTRNNGTLTIEKPNGFSLMHGSSYIQGSTGVFATTIDANAHTLGQLSGGPVSLDGTLRVTTVGAPLPDSSWPVIDLAARTGSFSVLDVGYPHYDVEVEYVPSGVNVIYHPVDVCSGTPPAWFCYSGFGARQAPPGHWWNKG